MKKITLLLVCINISGIVAMEHPVKEPLYKKDAPYASPNENSQLKNAIKRGDVQTVYQLLLNYRFADMQIKNAICSNEEKLADAEIPYSALIKVRRGGYLLGQEQAFDNQIWPLRDEIRRRKEIRAMLNGIRPKADEESDWFE